MDNSNISLADFLFPSRRLKKFAFLRKNDVWAAVWVTDILTVPITILLSRLRHFCPTVTPNALSYFSFLFFFTGIALFYFFPQQVSWTVLCFFLSVFFDDIDGKFARETKDTSTFGEITDQIIDMLNHSVGLILLGLLFSLRIGSLFPFFVLCPYAFFMGAFHINIIAQILMKKPEADGNAISTGEKWRKFCDARGLIYNPFTLYEVYLLIVLVAPWFKDPSLFLLGVIALFVLTCIYRRILIIQASGKKPEREIR